jgi:hypothetical protein
VIALAGPVGGINAGTREAETPSPKLVRCCRSPQDERGRGLADASLVKPGVLSIKP